MWTQPKFFDSNYEEHNHHKNDIALVKIDGKLPSEYIIPLCTESYNNKYLRVCGMGYLDWNHKKSPKVLQELQVLVTQKDCYTRFWEDLQVCANGGYAGSTTCFGDSGGPLFPLGSNHEAICLYGLVSYGVLGCLPSSTIYTRVSGYRKWIDSHIYAKM